MATRYKFPEFYENLNKLLSKCLTLDSHAEVMTAIEQHHLVLAWDKEDNDGVPDNLYLGALVGVQYHGTEVKYEVDWCRLYNGDISRVNFKHIAVIPDKECPKVFVNDSRSQNVGLLVGLNRVDEYDSGKDVFIVRVPPFVDGYAVKQVGADRLCLLNDIKLGITEDTENAG